MKRTRKVTISDVATACGVAPSTVSNALTGRKFVREDIKTSVLKTAEHLGYKASMVARGLRMNRTWSIALMVGDITNPFFPELVHGAEDALIAAGYQLILINTNHSPEKQLEAIRHLQERQIDGLIMATQTLWREGDEKHVNPELPIVMINQSYPGVEADIVQTDNELGMYDVCSHLWEQGHRRIGFIRGLYGSPAADHRFAGFTAAMARLGTSAEELVVDAGDHTAASGEIAARRLLKRVPDLTAIVSGNDLMAIGAMEAVEKLNLQVPRDISVVGNDDIFVSAFARINLTTLRQPKRDLGLRAVELLLERIEFGPRPVKSVKVAPTFIVRGTTGRVPH